MRSGATGTCAPPRTGVRRCTGRAVGGGGSDGSDREIDTEDRPHTLLGAGVREAHGAGDGVPVGER